MIIVQTPIRVSLFGGGTDFPGYFQTEGGCVLSTAIDKYVFVTVKKRFDDMVRVGYTRTELVEDVSQVQHELIREALCKTGIRRGVEVTTMADIPSAGSGLGSSGAVTVGALHAMYIYQGELVLAERLAREACEIEIETLSKPVGVQDQYIAAYGGFRWMEFKPGGEISLERIQLPSPMERELNESLILFFTGITRDSSSVLAEQESMIEDRLATLREIGDMAREARTQVVAGNFEAIGPLLHESWGLKRRLASKVSNEVIDEMYDSARRAGAMGGKITGAGGGGFLLLHCPNGRRSAVRHALRGLRELPFQFEPDGSKVIFNYRR
jgi:D-glycero-alpha-D-manno-heptose-7-phosphate kinase